MSKKKEREVILDSIEDEYRHDLSLHLYSTFLYHQINPLFPRRNWSSWPLPFDRVPDPRSSKIFIDSENFIGQFEGIDHEVDVHQKKKIDTGTLTDTEDKSTDVSDDSEDSVTKDKEIHTEKRKPYMRIRSVATQETLSNSKDDIMIELHALLEKKIHHRLKTVSDKLNLTMSTDISSNMTNEVCKKLANKVDHVVNNIINFQKQGNIRLSSSRPYPRLLNWQDILLAGLDVDESQDKILDTNRHASLYQKCERLFKNTNFAYEYDTEKESDSGSDLEITESEHTSSVKKKPKFNYLDYLSKIEESHSGIINYDNFKERILKNRNQERKLKELKKQIYMRKLHLQYKYNDISWSEAKKRLKLRDGRIPKKFRIQNEDKESQRKDALAHGGIQLTAEDFTVNI